MIFDDLNVNKEIVKGLNEMGVKEPTDIQEKSIPLIKEGKDLIGISKTGSGKTAAFGVPILEKIKHGQG
ncbi:MAG TPA: DEAD/DEAH box helicase, partial [Candidatus Woesearchaeota archaeon]|nr:DEAD/DEAH box helicase [Candidatus Woesearchaeota archaeon]